MWIPRPLSSPFGSRLWRQDREACAEAYREIREAVEKEPAMHYMHVEITIDYND